MESSAIYFDEKECGDNDSSGLPLKFADGMWAIASEPLIQSPSCGIMVTLAILQQHHDKYCGKPIFLPYNYHGVVAEARVVWRFVLKQNVGNLSDTCKTVLQIYDDWESSELRRFYNYYTVRGNVWEDQKQMAYFKTIFDETTEYFTNFYSNYIQLVRTHINVNAHSLKQADENFRFNKYRQRVDPMRLAPANATHPYEGDDHWTERAFIYAENFPKVIQEMEKFDIEESLPQPHRGGSPSYRGRTLAHLGPERRPLAQWLTRAWNMGLKVVTREDLMIPSACIDHPGRVCILYSTAESTIVRYFSIREGDVKWADLFSMTTAENIDT
ncbi:hypothetical protein BKA66DRAFT_601518 [Pyrenochaeta sp. MPI-SDFR-AT-0127]|nr:hypothetical protein BKA66DRAFT_601518 [Pyrenochaeta sp. MPI-SDFR-AT-0127]